MDTTRTPQRAARRREEILDTAATLFATLGIADVSTGRIATDTGISAGNLYYWFRNKAEIVRALFARWMEESTVQVTEADASTAILTYLWEQGSRQTATNGRYGFLARELLGLLHTDPELLAAYQANLRDRTAVYAQLFERLIADGLVSAPRPPVTITDVIHANWVVTELGAAFAQALGGDVDPTSFGRVTLGPLLTDRGRATLGVDE